jgi:hypothetical protein
VAASADGSAALANTLLLLLLLLLVLLRVLVLPLLPKPPPPPLLLLPACRAPTLTCLISKNAADTAVMIPRHGWKCGDCSTDMASAY